MRTRVPGWLLRRAIARPLAVRLGSDTGVAASVVVTTRNRGSYLELTLASFEAQLFPRDAWELVVVDDASEDETAAVLDACEGRAALTLVRARSDVARGPWRSRNEALQLSRGQFVILVEDDGIVAPDFLVRHLIRHLSGPCVVLGDVRRGIHSHIGPQLNPALWRLAELLGRRELSATRAASPRRVLEPEDVRDFAHLTPLMFWERHKGLSAHEILGHADPANSLAWLCFSTANASVPRGQILAVGGFDDTLTGADVAARDLGHRLHRAGLRFEYDPNALALRQLHEGWSVTAGERALGLRQLARKHPELRRQEFRPLLLGKETVAEWRRRTQSKLSPLRAAGPAPGGGAIMWWVAGESSDAAVRDAGLAREVQRLQPAARVQLVSGGIAARCLRELGCEVTDLGAEVTGDRRARVEALAALARELQPALLVASDDASLMAVAAGLGIPGVLLTSELPTGYPGNADSAAASAARILVPDLAEAYDFPQETAGQVAFCGPWFEGAPVADPVDWRVVLDAADRTILLVLLEEGCASATRLIAHIWDAARQFSRPTCVVIVGPEGRDDSQWGDNPPVRSLWLPELPANPASLFCAADVAICHASHLRLWQLAAAGVPTIAIPAEARNGRVPATLALRMAHFGSCVYLPEVLATAEGLRQALYQVLETPLGAELGAAVEQIDLAACRERAAGYLLAAAGWGSA